MLGDDRMNLLITGSTYMENFYCLIGCNPSRMLWLTSYLCSPGLTHSMSSSHGAKESCDGSLLMSFSGCKVALQQLFPLALES